MASQDGDTPRAQDTRAPFSKSFLIQPNSFRMKGASNPTAGSIRASHEQRQVLPETKDRPVKGKDPNTEDIGGTSNVTREQRQEIQGTQLRPTHAAAPAFKTDGVLAKPPRGDHQSGHGSRNRGSSSFIGQSIKVYERPPYRRSYSDDSSTQRNSNEVDGILPSQKQAKLDPTADRLTPRNMDAGGEECAGLEIRKEPKAVVEQRERNERLEMTSQSMRPTIVFNVGSNLLHLIKHHPLEVNANVEICPDIKEGTITIMGNEEDQVKQVNAFIVRKIENAQSYSTHVSEFEICYLEKENIKHLLDKTLHEKKIQCYWKVEGSFVTVNAWDRETIGDFFKTLDDLSVKKKYRVHRDDKADYKLVQMYKSQHWEMIKTGMKCKFKDTFYIRTFVGDDEHTYLGIIAPKDIFKQLWTELEVHLTSFAKSLHGGKPQQIQGSIKTHEERTTDDNEPGQGSDVRKVAPAKQDLNDYKATGQPNDETDKQGETGHGKGPFNAADKGNQVEPELQNVTHEMETPPNTKSDKTPTGTDNRYMDDKGGVTNTSGRRQLPRTPAVSTLSPSSSMETHTSTPRNQTGNVTKDMVQDVASETVAPSGAQASEKTKHEMSRGADGRRKQTEEYDDQASGVDMIEFKPADDEMHIWKFAVGCPTVNKRIHDIVKTDFELNDEGLIKAHSGTYCHCKESLKNALNISVTDVDSQTVKFAFGNLGKIYAELKSLIKCRDRPTNPYQIGDARVFLVRKEEYGEIVLIALDIYFEKCLCDIQSIVTKCKESSDGTHNGENKDDPAEVKGKEQVKETEKNDADVKPLSITEDRTQTEFDKGKNGRRAEAIPSGKIETEIERSVNATRLAAAKSQKDIGHSGDQPTRIRSKPISCEEWKWNYLQKYCDDLSTLQTTFNVTPGFKGNNTLIVYGNNHENVNHVETELTSLLKRLVQVTPNREELHIWRFAFTSPAVSQKLQDEFGRHDMEAGWHEDTVVVRFKSSEITKDEGDIRQIIFGASKHIRSRVFKFIPKAKDDIEQDIGFLKMRKETTFKPVNSFKRKEAEVYMSIENRSELGQLVLVAIDERFEMCCKEVLSINETYDKESNKVTIDKEIGKRDTLQHQVELDKGGMPEANFDLDKNKSDKDGNSMAKEVITSNRELSLVNSPPITTNVLTVRINCEKWKFECLKNIDGYRYLDDMTKKFHVKLELKDERTLCIMGERPSDVEQFRTDIRAAMKKLIREIYPVDMEHYENLQSDQDYKTRMAMFEKKYHVTSELRGIMEFEDNVEIQVEGLNVILTREANPEIFLTIELQLSQQGCKFIVGKSEFLQTSLDNLVDHAISNCNSQTLAIDLDHYEEQRHELTQLVRDFVDCLVRKTKRRSQYTLYICTQRVQVYFRMKVMLSGYNKPTVSHQLSGPLINIEVIQGELAKQKVDVIVNSSNENLDLSQGAVSNSLLKIAGKEMQNEINRKYSKPIEAGQIAETKGYGLRVQRVLHSCLHSWNTRSSQKEDICRKTLQQFVRNCLQRTEDLKLKSIAFPALGTGVLKYPPELVAEEMMTTVHHFNKDNPHSCIAKVIIVIYLTDIKLFEVFKETQQRLTATNTDRDSPEDMLEHCVVIAGRKEHVTKAISWLKTELLSPCRPDISGRFDGPSLDSSTRQRGNSDISVNDDADADYSTIKDEIKQRPLDNCSMDPYYTGLTADKGAIPKKTTVPPIKNKSPELPGHRDNRGSPERREHQWNGDELNSGHKFKRQTHNATLQKDLSYADTILDQFLEDVTVSLHTGMLKELRQPELGALKKRLNKDYNVKMDWNKSTLNGKAKDIALTEIHVIDMMNGYGTADQERSDDLGRQDETRDIVSPEERDATSTKSDISEDDSEDHYDVIDYDFEQHVLERTLSRAESITDQRRQLKNVRREVFMVLKIYYKDQWEREIHGCDVDFHDGEITVQCQDREQLLRGYRFVKSGMKTLDVFYFCDLPSHKPAIDVIKACEDVKDASETSGTSNDVYFYVDDGMVRLAGSSFEQVDEFSKLVGLKLDGSQPRSRANRKLGAVTSKKDNKSLLFATSLVNPSVDKRLTSFTPESQPDCQSFVTDEDMTIYVYKANILELKVDGIVNAANSSLKHGGGIAKVIANAAGNAFEKESRDYISSLGQLPVGSSCTTSAGLLPYKRVIHTVGPCMSDYTKDQVDNVNQDLYDAIYSSLDEAKGSRLNSIGIPSVSSGVFGVPKKWCALQYCLAVKAFSKKNWDCCLKEVHFIDIDEEMLHIIGLTCDVIFNANAKAKKTLKQLKCEPNENQKAKILRIFGVKKNFKRQRSAEDYPRIRHSLRSKIKFEFTPTFQVAVRKGNIVDFDKGVIVCIQDPDLKCHGGIVRAIKDREPFYEGNLRRRYNKIPYRFGDVLVQPCKTLRCSLIYNVILTHQRGRGRHDMNDVSLCYTQVLQKADQNEVDKIAIPLFAIGKRGEYVERSGKALSSALIEFANSKGRHHKFPDVYIYNDDKRNVEMLIRVMKDVLIEKTKPRKEPITHNSDDDEQYGTPPTSPVSERRKESNLRRLKSQESQDAMKYDRDEYMSDKVSQTGGSDVGGAIVEPEATTEPKPLDKNPIDGTMESMKCAICMDSFTNPKTLPKCGHTFCTECIDDYFKVKPVCPFCFTAYGILTGTQPYGHMDDYVDRYTKLPGYEKYGIIRIQYSFADGIQGDEHPSPGKRYHGTRRTAYLPDSAEGRKVLKLLKLAFKRRLVFTIGRSVTTGVENVVTWNDIHHKTNIHGGPSNYGYPDPEYLTRVTAELAAKGVTEDDLE